MTTTLAAVIVIATLVAMTSGKVPPVLALGTGLALAGLTKVASVSTLFAGLSNGGVITVAGMLVIAKGIVKTGVIARVTWRLLATVESAQQAVRRLIVPVGVASALMNTTPLVAMLVPASKQLEQAKAIPAREVLLPVAHATTLVGSVTLIGTSSNLLIAGIASGGGVDVSMLSFAPVALPVCLVGWVVLLVTAPRMLRGHAVTEQVPQTWRVEIRVAANANAVGRRPADIGVEQTQEFSLTSVVRRGQPLPTDAEIAAGDTLVFSATEAGVTALWESPRFGLVAQPLYQVSVGIAAHGTLRQMEESGDVRVIAAETRRPLRDTGAVPGSTVFVTAPGTDALAEHESFTVWADAAGRAPQPAKTQIAIGILVAVVVAASFGLAPVELVAFAGALVMVITRVLTPTSAVRALDWNVLFILAGSVGLGGVVVESGLAQKISDAIESVSAGSLPLVVIVFAVTTALMTNLVTNAAAASILTPVALGIAGSMGLDPVLLLAVIATCISFTFINPFSHQSNLMVMRPGGYSTATFARFGVPLFLVSLVTVSVVGYLLLRTG